MHLEDARQLPAPTQEALRRRAVRLVEEKHFTHQQAAEAVGVPVPRVLVGIIPPKSAEAARYMNKSVVGISIPESFIALLERAPDPAAESIRFCTDLVEQIKPVCSSFHFMPVGMVSRMPALLDACFPAQLSSRSR